MIYDSSSHKVLLRGFKSSGLYKLDLSKLNSFKGAAQSGVSCSSIRNRSMNNCIEYYTCDSSLLSDHTKFHNKTSNYDIAISDNACFSADNSCCSATMCNDSHVFLDSPYFSPDISCGTHIATPGRADDSEFVCLISTLNSKDSSSLWHMRLGHPSSKLLNNFLRLHNLPMSHNST